jgi:hypothetical protein
MRSTSINASRLQQRSSACMSRLLASSRHRREDSSGNNIGACLDLTLPCDYDDPAFGLELFDYSSVSGNVVAEFRLPEGCV